jgi:epoxyqueuosine reductase
MKQTALEAGFDRCGVAAAKPISRGDFYAEWLARDRCGSMAYLRRHQNSRRDIRAWLPWAKSVIVVAANYHQSEPPAQATGSRNGGPPACAPGSERGAASEPLEPAMNCEARGRVAMYAWGDDYHIVLRERLQALVEQWRTLLAEQFRTQLCVDTSAIIEREYAAAAGIGWIGKNTLILHESLGSFFFLGEVVTDLDLAVDEPVADRCGTCTRCLDACPTAAFPQAHVMDARRCISYLTIEHRDEIPADLASRMGDWVFGCDVCQTVCPFNRRAPEMNEPRWKASLDDARPVLDEIMSWDEAAYQVRVRGKARDRARLAMWQRNARIARANLKTNRFGSSANGRTSPE